MWGYHMSLVSLVYIDCGYRNQCGNMWICGWAHIYILPGSAPWQGKGVMILRSNRQTQARVSSPELLHLVLENPPMAGSPLVPGNLGWLATLSFSNKRTKGSVENAQDELGASRGKTVTLDSEMMWVGQGYPTAWSEGTRNSRAWDNLGKKIKW